MNDFLQHIFPNLNITLFSLDFFIPELVLIAGFVVAIFVDLFVPQRNNSPVFYFTLGVIVLSAFFSFRQMDFLGRQPVPLFAESIALDKLAVKFKIILAAAFVLFLFFIRDNRQLSAHSKGTGDLYCILIAAQLGLHLMVMASSLLTFYISIEMVSVASYIMVGYISGTAKQTEAAMKYALFGGVCSAMMLYGISLLYAFTGTLIFNKSDFIFNLLAADSLGAGFAIILILIGIGYKLSFAPLHFWSPDVYEGAPTPVTAFLSTAPKIAGFAVLLRFLSAFQLFRSGGFAYPIFDFNLILSVIAISTMVIGNFSALWQDNVKRMLAYSSIGHTGFLLMAIIAYSPTGFKSLLFYLFVYALMNMAAFFIADKIEEKTGATNISDYKGLGKVLKVELVCLVIVLIALTGLPPTAGFIAKFLVFSSALQLYAASKSIIVLLVMITGALATVVSLFYYFKVPLNAYLRESSINIQQQRPSSILLPVILTFLLLFLGIFPGFLTDFFNR